WDRSACPSPRRDGVPTAMNTASAPRTDSPSAVVNANRPCSRFERTISPSPGSKIGISPAFRVEIFILSLSTHVTWWPKSAIQAPETRPTKQLPIIVPRMPATPTSAAIRRRLHRYHLLCSALNVMHGQIMLRIYNMSPSRTEFRAVYLLPIACMASLAPVGALAPCPLAAADQTAQLRSFEEPRSYDAQSTAFAATNAGTWRLVRTPNPRGGPDAVSIMQTADATRSDIDLAGLTLRCSDTGFDVLVVFLKPFPPRRHPKVKLTTAGA